MSGTLRDLYTDDPQAYANNLRGYLEQNGIPLTANNLNAISLAVSQQMRGEQTMPDFDAAVERTMQPRRASGTRAPQGRAAPAQPAAAEPAAAAAAQDAVPEVRLDAGKDLPEAADITSLRDLVMSAQTARDGQPEPNARGEVTRGAQVAYDNTNAAADANVDPRGGGAASARAAQEGNIARGNTIPRARYIDENDPTAGMFDPRAPGGRQADETGVDQAGLAAALASPALAAGGTALAARLLAGRQAQPAYTAMQNYQRQRLTDAIATNPARVPPSAAPAPAQQWQPFTVRPEAANMPPVPAAATPARVTMNGRSGTAVREPYNPAGDSAGRTALSQRMTSRAQRNEGRRVSETAGTSRRDGAQR